MSDNFVNGLLRIQWFGFYSCIHVSTELTLTRLRLNEKLVHGQGFSTCEKGRMTKLGELTKERCASPTQVVEKRHFCNLTMQFL